jgi:hypothetical protein
LLNKEENKNEIIFKIISEQIEKDPDLLCFGDEISYEDCEYIITLEDEIGEKYIKLNIDSKFYRKLYMFGKIGKKYYKT